MGCQLCPVDTREIITMWRTVGLLFVVTAASALPAQPAKQGKSFSLFSVVSFPNDECTTTMDPTMQGICKTTEECTEDGGTASGNCASGFGVCCFTTIEEAGAITNNITYIQNSGYPTAVGNTGTAASSTNQFTVTGGASICQVRLDFDTAVFQVPTTQAAAVIGGVCNVDQITVVQPAATLTGISNLCGTLTGQHLYINNDGADTAATININYNVANAVLFARSWKIKVSLLGCDNPSLAPNGCLQYFTGNGGQVTSFNGGLTGDTGEMLVDQQYSACVRQEAGMCRIQWQEARLSGNPDSFGLAGALTAAMAGTDCTMVYVKIPSSAALPATSANVAKYCGTVLANTNDATVASPVISDVVPFRLEVVSITQAVNVDLGAGFDLTYSQLPC